MLSPASRHAFSIFLVVALALTAVFAQSKPGGQRQSLPQPSPTPPPEPEDIETLKTDTDLVTVPIIATDRSGLYITDLRQEEFKILEDGVPQEIAFFGKVAAPFHVVLMLDTSSSTKDHLYEFATLRAMGASNSYIFQVIICQALVNAIIGFAIAALIGAAIVHFTAKSALQVVITPYLIIALCVVTIVMCIVSAITAISRVVRVDPAIVLTR